MNLGNSFVEWALLTQRDRFHAMFSFGARRYASDKINPQLIEAVCWTHWQEITELANLWAERTFNGDCRYLERIVNYNGLRPFVRFWCALDLLSSEWWIENGKGKRL